MAYLSTVFSLYLKQEEDFSLRQRAPHGMAKGNDSLKLESSKQEGSSTSLLQSPESVLSILVRIKQEATMHSCLLCSGFLFLIENILASRTSWHRSVSNVPYKDHATKWFSRYQPHVVKFSSGLTLSTQRQHPGTQVKCLVLHHYPPLTLQISGQSQAQAVAYAEQVTKN